MRQRREARARRTGRGRGALPARVAQRHPVSGPVRDADHADRAAAPDRGRRGRRAGGHRPLALLRRPRDGRHLRVERPHDAAVDEPRSLRSRGRSSAGTTTSSCTRAARASPVCSGRGSWRSRSLPADARARHRRRRLHRLALRQAASAPRATTSACSTSSRTPATRPTSREPGIELVEGDICDADAVAEAAAGCDAIVNFAAETHVDRSILGATDFGRTEFFGTQVLLEEVRRSGARFVQVSTDEVYGDLAGGGSAVETDPVRPSSPYSVAKAAGDLHIRRTRGRSASTPRSRAARTPTGRTSTRRS